MKKLVAVYSPMNPARPSYGRLKRLHEANVEQNDPSLFDYFSEEVLLHPNYHKHGLWRGQNVVHHFNQFYERVKHDYLYICKWDDDIILPPSIIDKCIWKLENSGYLGIGLFQEDYGKPNVLLENSLETGWYGAFSRFYMYRMDAWSKIPVETPWLTGESPNIEGHHSGDPDNSFQISLKGNKHILDVPSIHLDHRAFPNRNNEYRVMMDVAGFFIQ